MKDAHVHDVVIGKVLTSGVDYMQHYYGLIRILEKMATLYHIIISL